MPKHIESAPESKIIGKETVQIKTLNDTFDNLVDENDIVLLKIDVQGFEKNVLEGANLVLKKIDGIQIEMSIEELYKEEVLFSNMLVFLESLGYKLFSLENGFYDDETGKLLQVDGLFFRD